MTKFYVVLLQILDWMDIRLKNSKKRLKMRITLIDQLIKHDGYSRRDDNFEHTQTLLHPMPTANQVADWFLSNVDKDAGDGLTPLKLQKLLYYAQAWHLVNFDNTPLFNEPIEAWSDGPVVPSVYSRFKEDFQKFSFITNIELPENPNAPFSPEQIQLLKEVLTVYGEHSSGYLRDLTHSETPWIKARGELKPHERCNREIDKEEMVSYYTGLRDGKQA